MSGLKHANRETAASDLKHHYTIYQRLTISLPLQISTILKLGMQIHLMKERDKWPKKLKQGYLKTNLSDPLA